MDDVARLSRSQGAGQTPGDKLTRHTKAQPRQALPRAKPLQHYFAFLSYSHADQETAEWLHEAIENFRVPKKLVGRLTDNGPVPRRLTPVFRDRGELAAADDLGEEIEEALAGSRFMVVLCSPAAVKSRWTNAEIAAFKRLRPDGSIFAAIIGGEPFASDIPGREAEECFPPALLQKYDRRGRPTGKRAEPIAADLRAEGDGRQMGLLKVIAGMLGVGLDDLVQREGQRRQRRMQAIAAASLIGMILTTGLSVTAIQSRDAARDQRREAEGLVAFMLGDLKEKLEPIGELDALGGVGSKVLAYYSKQDTSQLSDAGLMQRAQALSLMAQVANSRGDLVTAQKLYSQALQGTAEGLRRDPSDPQRLFDHAQNIFWIGEIARSQGQMEGAEAAYREYKQIADRLVAIEPDNLRWRMEVLYAVENIGIALRNQRRFVEAAGQFRRALGPMESLASVDPANAEYQKELSTIYAWSADAERELGRLDAAIQLRERQIAHLRRLVETGQRNVVFREHLIPAHQGLGMLFIWTGQRERAISQFRLAVAEAVRLVPVEPDNIRWKGYAAQARLEFGKALLAAGSSAEAGAEARAACELASQVQARDAPASWRHLRTDCLGLKSRLAVAGGQLGEALKLGKMAVASAKTERRPDPVSIRYRVAAAQRHLGDIHRQMDQADAARSAWLAALALLPRKMPERPIEIHERALLLERIGKVEEAAPLRDRLATIGFKA